MSTSTIGRVPGKCYRKAFEANRQSVHSIDADQQDVPHTDVVIVIFVILLLGKNEAAAQQD
jgi:hypothetical protein